ncbi:hypothetical protein Cantr_03833 [Candida viswanathii]|uniref:GATA-type domain-containing protein n=1 Tax=Candida viswanathii TaxID=5486 RepID=A0A367XMI7_9ASCO|nr:hypothetical protein Cantr_03833 [Candida viswanathii]
MNGSKHHIQSSSLPRLPSFQQLNETIRNPEIAQVQPPLQHSHSQSNPQPQQPQQLQQQQLQSHHQLASHRFQYTANDYKTLMLYNNNNNTTANGNYAAHTLSNPNATNNNAHMEYSYGPSLHDRSESYPNQYVFPNPETLKQPLSNRVSPRSMDRTKTYSYGQEFANQLNNGKLGNVISEYKFVNDLIQFLMRFEIKCNELKRYSTNTPTSALNDMGDSNSVITENFMSALSVEDLDEALNNIKRIAQIFESIKVHNEHNKSNGLKRNGLFVYENGAKRQHIEKKKQIRKKQLKNGTAMNGSLIAGGEIVPMDVHMNHSGTSTNCVNGNGNGQTNGNGHVNDATGSDHPNVALQRCTTGGLNPQLTLKPDITCQHCCSQETPEWRRGPEGSRTLCNACGLFYSKLIKKYGLREADKVMLQRKQTGTVNDRRIF